MSLIVSFDVTIKCNSSFEKVSDEGIECCQSSFTQTHHIQPEHYRREIAGLILETYASAIGVGWNKTCGTVEDLYCPQCYTEIVQSSEENDWSLGKQGYAFPVN